MSSLRPLDMRLMEQLFERATERGYVLDFSDRTFADFFEQELGIDINKGPLPAKRNVQDESPANVP